MWTYDTSRIQISHTDLTYGSHSASRCRNEGLNVNHLRCTSVASSRRHREAPVIAEDLYELMRGARRSTGTLCARGLFGNALGDTRALFARTDDFASDEKQRRTTAATKDEQELRRRTRSNTLRECLALSVASGSTDDDSDADSDADSGADSNEVFTAGAKVTCTACGEQCQVPDIEGVELLVCTECQHHISPLQPLSYEDLTLGECKLLYADYGWKRLSMAKTAKALAQCRAADKAAMVARLRKTIEAGTQPPVVAEPTTTSGDADEPTTTSGDAPTLQRYVGLEHMHPLQLQALYAASRFELGKRCLSSRRGGDAASRVHGEVETLSQELSALLQRVAELEPDFESRVSSSLGSDVVNTVTPLGPRFGCISHTVAACSSHGCVCACLQKLDALVKKIVGKAPAPEDGTDEDDEDDGVISDELAEALARNTRMLHRACCTDVVPHWEGEWSVEILGFD